MKNFFVYLILILVIVGCNEQDPITSQKKLTTPTKTPSVIQWAFFNSEGFQNISFPIWFNDSIILKRDIRKIRFTINKFEPTKDSTYYDTLPSILYEVGYSKNGVTLFYVTKFAEEVKIEEQWFRYRGKKDSLGYSIANIRNHVIYEENDFLPIFSTLQNAQQYKRLKFLESDSTTIKYINTLSAKEEKHIFITDSTCWNVHYIDLNFKNPEKNTFYYGIPSKYKESFKVKNLVEKEQITVYNYFNNDCLYQYSTFTNGFEKRRTFLYDGSGRITSVIDSLIVEPNDFMESVVSHIRYEEDLPIQVSTYKSKDSLLKNPIEEVRFTYDFFSE